MTQLLAQPFTTGQLLTWFDASGTAWPLNGEGAYLWLDGRRGFRGMPSFRTVESQTPLTDGAVARFTLADVRVVDLPIVTVGANPSDFYAATRALAAALNPKNGSGRLRSTAPDGTQRELTCRYDSGYEHDERAANGWAAYMQSILVFRAHDPYFYDVLATVQTFYASAAPTFFPITPLRLGTSQVLSSFSITNGGDVEAYPVWILKGPGSGIVLTNNTTGKSLALSGNGGLTLGASDSLTIDTKAKTLTKQDGSSQYASLSFTSSLWTLAQGYNSISITMTGTSAASSVQIQYKQRWLEA